jgi:hypothetical protein
METSDHAQSESDLKTLRVQRFEFALPVAGIEIDRADLYTVSLGIGDQLRGSIETQWLAVEHRAAEHIGMMVFDPARGIDKECKAGCMRFGKSVLAKATYLVKDRFSEFLFESVGSHPFDQFSFELIDHSWAPPSGHSSAQLVGFAGRESCSHDGQSHRLLLEDRDAHRFAKNLSDRFGRIGWLFAGASGCKVWVDHVSLDGPWADDGYLDHKIIKTSRPKSWQHAHLSAAFDLENPDGIGLAYHVVDRRVFGRDGSQIQILLMMNSY